MYTYHGFGARPIRYRRFNTQGGNLTVSQFSMDKGTVSQEKCFDF